MKRIILLLLLLFSQNLFARGTGDLGLIIERTIGSVQIIETTHHQILGQIKGLGDLSHASIVYSQDGQFGYIFGRDGGLTKVDLLNQSIVKRIMQSGNSIGGAISQDGKFIAVSNYTPGGVKVFNSDNLELVADIPAFYGNQQQRSKVIGLVDAPNHRFVFTLWDAGEIWIADMHHPKNPTLQKFKNIGKNPYDALISPDGHYYIAGLFGEDGMALLNLWHPERGIQRILPHYGKGEKKLPVYKMPHLEGWAMAGRYAFVPAVGLHQVLVIDTETWQEAGRINVKGQPIFVMARPDGREIWVNFAHPDNGFLQVIDTETLKITHTLQEGKAILHMEFKPRGEEIWISARDSNQVMIYDTETKQIKSRLKVTTPSGIFFTNRANKIGL